MKFVRNEKIIFVNFFFLQRKKIISRELVAEKHKNIKTSLTEERSEATSGDLNFRKKKKRPQTFTRRSL